MTESPPDDVALAIHLVEEATQTELALSAVDLHGSRAWLVRLSSWATEPTVSIYLTTTPYRALATLVPDTFSGAFLRAVGLRAVDAIDVWQAMLGEFEQSGTRVILTVNGKATAAAEAVERDWESLEIEADTKFTQPRNVNARGNALASSVLGVLSLFAACSEVDDTHGDEEGMPIEARSIRYERSRANRIRCLNFHGYDCFVCGFNFEQVYGSLGHGFVEVHHCFTVADMPPGYRPDPATEMVPLCANCHRMAHRSKPPIAPQDLREAIGG